MSLPLVHVRAEADVRPPGLDAREMPGFIVDPCPGMSITEIDLWKEIHEEQDTLSLNIRVEMIGVPQEPISEWARTFDAAVGSTFDLPEFELGSDGFVDAAREAEGTAKLISCIYSRAVDPIDLLPDSSLTPQQREQAHQAAMELAHRFTTVTIESGSDAALAQLSEMAQPMTPSFLDLAQWQQAAQEGIEEALGG